MCNDPDFCPEVPGVLCMETIGKIRRRKLVRGETISEIARDLNLSRNTVKKYLMSMVTQNSPVMVI